MHCGLYCLTNGELATLANGARFANLALLLARAQLEAELWSCERN